MKHVSQIKLRQPDSLPERRSCDGRTSLTYILQRTREDDEEDVVVCDTEPGEDLVEDVVERLEVEGELPSEGVFGLAELEDVSDSVHCGKEGAVEPATSLRQE